MGVKDIVRKIKEDTQNKVDSIMDREEEKAEEIREEIRKEKERKLKQIEKKKKREIKTMKNRILSQAKLEKRKKKLKIREEMIDRVMNRAKEKLEEIEPEEHEDFLRKSIGQASNVLKGEITLRCNDESEEMVSELADKIDPSLEIEGGLKTKGGIKAVSNKGSSIDLTFEANLERRRKGLRKEISDILFSEE